MASKIPYMTSPGLVPKILEKVQNARRPERFTQDFLETKLGHSGGSARPIIPFLKRMGFLGSDGVPQTLYDQFRNAETRGAAVAQGMRNAYKELFDRNEYVYDLSRDKLTNLIVEVTGQTKDDTTTKCIVGTFKAVNDLAEFEADPVEEPQVATAPDAPAITVPPVEQASPNTSLADTNGVRLQVGYTINLNLPETSDPEVFNVIFRALKEHLLKN